MCVHECVRVRVYRSYHYIVYARWSTETQQHPQGTRLGRSGDTELEPQAGLRASPLSAACPPFCAAPLPKSFHLREHGEPLYVYPASSASHLHGVLSLFLLPQRASRPYIRSPTFSLSLSLSLSLLLCCKSTSHVRTCVWIGPRLLARAQLVTVCAPRTSRGLFALSCLSMRHYTTYTCALRAGMLGPAEHERACIRI